MWSTLKSIVLRPGEYVRWRHEQRTTPVTPIQLYVPSAVVAFGSARLFGEENTGALFAAGGGVFIKLGAWGPWLAFVLTVPVLSVGLSIAFAGSGQNRFRKHVDFSLVFQAVVFLLVAVEVLLVRAVGSVPLARHVTQWGCLFGAAVYFVIAVAESYEQDVAHAFIRSAVVASVYAATMAGAVVLLAEIVGFRL